MCRRRARMLLGCLLGWAALAAGGAAGAAQEEFSSNNRERGRAAIEYRDADIHVVAAYYYSQRNHDSRWLMIQAAVSTTELTTIHRDAILIRTPDGRDIPLSAQRRVGEDVVRIRQLLQNASTVSHNVLSYFAQRERTENMQLFTLPFGDVVHDEFVADPHRVAAGTLFFESPRGLWERGTYRLVVRHPGGTAELPIRLE